MARLAQPLFTAAGLATGLLLPWSARILRVFGESFVEAARSLQWLLGAAALVYLGAALMTAIVATGRSRAVLVVASVGLLVNLAGNAVLVPRLGIDGAAISTFATEVLVALGALIALWRSGVKGLAGPTAAWRWAVGPVLFGVGFFASRALLAAIAGGS